MLDYICLIVIIGYLVNFVNSNLYYLLHIIDEYSVDVDFCTNLGHMGLSLK